MGIHDRTRLGIRLASVCATCLVLGLALGASADEDPCEGRNPLHCGSASTADDGTLLMPPGGCDGRNPLHCKESEPEVAGDKAVEPRRKQTRAGGDDSSRNPNRRRSGDSGGGSSGGSGSTGGGASGGSSGGSGGGASSGSGS